MQSIIIEKLPIKILSGWTIDGIGSPIQKKKLSK